MIGQLHMRQILTPVRAVIERLRIVGHHDFGAAQTCNEIAGERRNVARKRQRDQKLFRTQRTDKRPEAKGTAHALLVPYPDAVQSPVGADRNGIVCVCHEMDLHRRVRFFQRPKDRRGE